jgi:hypothetical protein
LCCAGSTASSTKQCVRSEHLCGKFAEPFPVVEHYPVVVAPRFRCAARNCSACDDEAENRRIRRGLMVNWKDQRACGRVGLLCAMGAYPCPTIGACVSHYSSSCKTAARDEDAALRKQQHGQGIRAESKSQDWRLRPGLRMRVRRANVARRTAVRPPVDGLSSRRWPSKDARLP